MASMPGMDDSEGDSKPKGKGLDLAIIMGKPGGKPPIKMPAKDDKQDDNELPHGFEEACNEAFPDMAGDMERMKACARMCRAVMSEEMADDY